MTRETITLIPIEQQRVIVLTQVREQRIDARRAAALLGLSLRQCRRLLAAFRRDGPAALAHGNRGRRAPNRVSPSLERRVVRLARTRYRGFNPQHLTEKLAEAHRIVLSRPTVHRILLAAGTPSPQPRRRRRFRRRRDRMPLPGLLLQWDGSHHDWLEGRGPRLVLHGAIDDATNEVPAAIFRPQEDAHGYFVVLRKLVRPFACGEWAGIHSMPSSRRARPTWVGGRVRPWRCSSNVSGRGRAALGMMPPRSP